MSKDLKKYDYLTGGLRVKKKFVLKKWHKFLVILPLIIIAALFRYSDVRKSYLLGTKGVSTVATVKVASFAGVKNPYAIENVAYSFEVEGKEYIGYTVARTNRNYVYTSLGIPLTPGDSFEMKYVSDNPDINEIDFDTPTNSTINKYLEFASIILQEFDFIKKINVSYDFTNCITAKIYNEFGLDGIADIIFHDELWIENFSNNSYTFKRLKKSDEFQAILESCR